MAPCDPNVRFNGTNGHRTQQFYARDPMLVKP
jgi:hypothetical protein